MSEKEQPKQKTQMDRFKEAARALDCDEDEAAFNEKLKIIAKQKTKKEPGRNDQATAIPRKD